MPRRPGSRNRKGLSFREALRRYCADKEVDPHYWMVDLLTKRGVRMELKLQAAKELAQYLEPKLHSTELTGDPEKPLQVVQMTAEERRQRIDELLARRNGHGSPPREEG